MRSGVWKELVLRRSRDVDRGRSGVRMLREGGGIISHYKEVVSGVVMLGDVVWLCL
jgi:hypothetical protein